MTDQPKVNPGGSTAEPLSAFIERCWVTTPGGSAGMRYPKEIAVEGARRLEAGYDALRRALEDLVDCQYDFPYDTQPHPREWLAAFERARFALQQMEAFHAA